MQITVYSIPNCGSCRFLKQKLNDKNITFTEVEDIDTIVELGMKTNILKAPIVEIDGQYFSDKETITKLSL